MGIDGIGKPGPAPPVGGAIGPAEVNESEPFRIEAGEAAEPIRGSEALAQLGRGELSLDAYLDSTVVEATTHLSGRLTAEQLDFVRGSLREQMATDPVLVELVRRTTGATPSDPTR